MSDTPHKHRNKPFIGVIGGTGLEQALGVDESDATLAHAFPDTPFGKPSAPITVAKWHGHDVAILKRHGVGHVHSPSHVPYRANIFALKMLGVTHIVASGATGSLREAYEPGHIVIVDQVIDKTYKREQSFFEKAVVHVEMAQPFCPVMRRWLLEASKGVTSTRVHDRGTYVCMEGPAFSTKAESNMHRQWGGDLIGMTAMPEAKLAREAEIAYALIGLPTDYDCWKPHDSHANAGDLLNEIIANLKKASAAGVELIKLALENTQMLADEPSPAHVALKLGMWSDRSHIDPAEIAKLEPIWGRYFK